MLYAKVDGGGNTSNVYGYKYRPDWARLKRSSRKADLERPVLCTCALLLGRPEEVPSVYDCGHAAAFGTTTTVIGPNGVGGYHAQEAGEASDQYTQMMMD